MTRLMLTQQMIDLDAIRSVRWVWVRDGMIAQIFWAGLGEVSCITLTGLDAIRLRSALEELSAPPEALDAIAFTQAYAIADGLPEDRATEIARAVAIASGEWELPDPAPGEPFDDTDAIEDMPKPDQVWQTPADLPLIPLDF
ncbi:MAG: hypothetical protein MH825_08345 [Cyanobacteria bacterium]|nr:hypothetical protein [Cyanobacteriota bacterium]